MKHHDLRAGAARLGRFAALMSLTFAARSAHAQEPPPAPPPPAAEPAPAPPAQASPPATQDAAPPLSGWHDGLFFLRDQDDDFRIYVQGRVHADSVSFFGPGVSNLAPAQALKSTFYLRRARLELSGEILHSFQWALSGEFGPTATDNASGQTATTSCTPDATTGALGCSARSSAVEAPLQKVIITDAFVNYAPSPWANVQVGQYLIPFTAENRISDNTTPFLERSIPVRVLGAPTQRDIGAMFWGEAPKTRVYYSIGIFNGDGPNRLNADSRYDVIGRVFGRPLAGEDASPLKGLQIGVSGRYGSRDKTLVGYDIPSLTTQGGYAFFSPTYRDSANRLEHILPSGSQWALAGEIFVPLGRFDVTSEIVHARTNTREAIDGYQLSSFTERFGSLEGYSYYVQAGAWIIGDRDIIGYAPYSKPAHVDLKKPAAAPRVGLQVLAKFEQLHLHYDGAGRGGNLDAKTPNGDIDANVFSLGANLWATKHVRFSANYVYNQFPNSAPTSASAKGGPVQSGDQRAVAPAQALAKGVEDSARDTAHELHELMFRLGVQF